MSRLDKRIVGACALLIVINLNTWMCLQLGKRQLLSQMHQAYTICYQSHYMPSGRLEAACGRALDATHTDFMCNATGNGCWLEVR